MRIVTALLIVVIVFSAVPVMAQDGADATVVPDRLNMRHGPGSQYAVIAQLARGTTLTLLGQNGSWVYGRTPDGQAGWLASGYVELRAGLTMDMLPFRDAPPDLGTPMDPPAGDDTGAGDGGDGGAAPANGGGFPEGSGVPGQTLAAVNIRTGPGTSYRIIRTLSSGLSVLAKGRTDTMDWVLINANGQDGWIYYDYIQLTSGYISNLPVSTTIVDQIVAPTTSSAAPAASAGADVGDGGAPPAPVAGGAGLAGFGYGGHVDSFAHPNLMQQAGMTWAKRQVRFQMGASGNVAAGAIQQAHANGFKILLGIVGDPNQMGAPGYYDDYARFVGEVAALGPDAIEVWNEMNIDREWPTGQINPARYTELLAKAYNAIKSANPNVAVISGAPAPTGAEGAFGAARVWNDDRYVRGMAAAGAANYMDCIGAHYNEGIVGPSQTGGDPRGEYYTRYFWGMVNTYYNAFGGAKPVCFTELGYLTPEGFGPLPGAFAWGASTSLGEQAAWLAQAVQLARSSGKVKLVIIWNVDFTNYGADPMAGYAIVRPDGSCPACNALAGVR
jgi:uncharacterized protein YraI